MVETISKQYSEDRNSLPDNQKLEPLGYSFERPNDFFQGAIVDFDVANRPHTQITQTIQKMIDDGEIAFEDTHISDEEFIKYSSPYNDQFTDPHLSSDTIINNAKKIRSDNDKDEGDDGNVENDDDDDLSEGYSLSPLQSNISFVNTTMPAGVKVASTDLNSWRTWGQNIMWQSIKSMGSELYLDIQRQNAAAVMKKLKSKATGKRGESKKYSYLSAMNKDFYASKLKDKENEEEINDDSPDVDDQKIDVEADNAKLGELPRESNTVQVISNSSIIDNSDVFSETSVVINSSLVTHSIQGINYSQNFISNSSSIANTSSEWSPPLEEIEGQQKEDTKEESFVYNKDETDGKIQVKQIVHTVPNTSRMEKSFVLSSRPKVSESPLPVNWSNLKDGGSSLHISLQNQKRTSPSSFRQSTSRDNVKKLKSRNIYYSNSDMNRWAVPSPPSVISLSALSSTSSSTDTFHAEISETAPSATETESEIVQDKGTMSEEDKSRDFQREWVNEILKRAKKKRNVS